MFKKKLDNNLRQPYLQYNLRQPLYEFPYIFPYKILGNSFSKSLSKIRILCTPPYGDPPGNFLLALISLIHPFL